MVIMSLSSCFPTHYALVSQILSESHPMSALYCPFSNSGHHSAISLSILAESPQIKGLPMQCTISHFFCYIATFPPCRIVSVLQAGGRLVHGGNVDCVIIITVVVACWANKLRTHNAAPRCTRASTTPSWFPTFVLSNYVKCYNLLFILIQRKLFLLLEKN